MINGWLVEFERDDGELPLTKRNGNIKSFSNLDIASDVIHSLSFNEITVLE